MIGHKNLRFTFFLLIVVALASCSRVDDGFRCSSGSSCGQLNVDENAANLGLSCSAVPEASSVAVNQIFNVTLSGSGGQAPYYVSSLSGPRSFNPTTTVSGGYKTAGTKREFITIYDSSGLSASCPLDVVVEQGAGCNITVADDNYSPLVDENLQFRFQAYGTTAGQVVTYEFIPDAHRATNLGYVLTKAGATAAFDYKYTTPGIKRPLLFVTTTNSWDSCEIAALPVRKPDFTVKGKRYAELGEENQIHLEMEDNGEFGGTITYSYELIDDNATVSVVENLNEITITSSTSAYLTFKLKITAKVGSDGPEVVKEVELEFVPARLCTVAAQGASSGIAIRGDKVSFNISPNNSDTVDVHNVILPSWADLVSGRNDDGTYKTPVQVRFRSLGERKVTFVAQTRTGHERCESAAGTDPSFTVDVRTPVACTAVATPWRANTNTEVDLNVEVPAHAGIGPFRINNITASNGAGLSEVTASRNKRTFSSSEAGLQVIKFNTGRPGNGLTSHVDVELLDQGDPEGRKYSCRTTVTSVLPAGQAMCTAHFERDGSIATSARTREDNLDLVVNANFTNYAQLYSYGSEVVPQGHLLNHPLPFKSHIRFDRSSNSASRSAATEIGVWDGASTFKRCTAPLTLTGNALSCSIDFPVLPHSTAGGSNNAIVIGSETTFPGNLTNNALGKKLVTFTGHVNHAIATATNTFDDKSGTHRTFTVSKPLSNGIYNANVNLVGEYTRHGQYGRVSNHVKDSYDSVGSSCSANKNMYAHLMRTGFVYGDDGTGGQLELNDNAYCYIKATNITPNTLRGATTPNGSKATIWTFGHATPNAANLTNRDCHNLESVYKKGWNHSSTYCVQKFRVKNGACELVGKALGWHTNDNYAANPGDFKIQVWASNHSNDTSGVNAIGRVYTLPNLCQVGSSCQN